MPFTRNPTQDRRTWNERIQPPWTPYTGRGFSTPEIAPNTSSNMPILDPGVPNRLRGETGIQQAQQSVTMPYSPEVKGGPAPRSLGEGGSDSVQLVDAINRLLSGSRMTPESQRDPGPSMQDSAPMTPESQREPGQSVPGAEGQQARPTSGATAMVQQIVNQQRPQVPSDTQIDPMMYLHQYGAAKDRITKALSKEADFADIAQAMLAGSGSRGDFGSILNALKAQKIKEQMSAYEMERDYAKTALDVYGQTTGAKDPAGVATDKYLRSLTPEQREEYLSRMWAPSVLNLGDRAVVIPRGGAGAAGATYDKGVAPQDQPGFKGKVSEEQKLGETRAERTTDRPKAEAALSTEIAQLDAFGGDLTELRQHPGLSGITGSIMGRLPEVAQAGRTDASNAQALLNSIAAKASDLKLAMYRAAARTGTPGIGQITEREWPRFERMIKALGQEQDTPTFQRRLNELQAFLINYAATIKDQFDQTYGAGQQAPARQDQPKVIDFNQLPPG